MDVPVEAPPPGAPSDSEPHGQAALLLVESLLHGLTARGVLTVAEAAAIIEVALDAQRAIVEDAAQPGASGERATALLSSIGASMKIDLPDPDL